MRRTAEERSPTDDRYVYIFLHVPKTGGTTINGHLRQHLVFDEEFVHLGDIGDAHRRNHGLPPFEDRSAAERGRARVLAGHRVRPGVHRLVPGREPRYLTLLRDPADRILSVYHYRTSLDELPDQRFEDWYPTFPRNVAFKWLKRGLGTDSIQGVLKALREFWFVGTTEHLNDDLPGLFRSIGVPTAWRDLRVAGGGNTGDPQSHRVDPFGLGLHEPGLEVSRRTDLTPEMRERIRADNRRDTRLHRFALKRRVRTRWD